MESPLQTSTKIALRVLSFILVLAALLLGPSSAAAQSAACVGHFIERTGGAPRFAMDQGPRYCTQPVPETPPGMDRGPWDAVVFEANDRPEAR